VFKKKIALRTPMVVSLLFKFNTRKRIFRIRTSSITRDLSHQARISMRVALPDHLHRKTGKIFQLNKTSA